MALISDLTHHEPIPSDPAHYLVLRALRRKERQAAREAREAKVFAKLRAMGGDVLKAIAGADRTEVAQAMADPFNDYDQDSVLAAGVTGWSYPEDLDLDRLDEETAEAAFRQVLRLSGVKGETDPKAASSPS